MITKINQWEWIWLIMEKNINREGVCFSMGDSYLNSRSDLHRRLHRQRNVYVSLEEFVLVVHFASVLSKRQTIPSNVWLDRYDCQDRFSNFLDDRDQSIVIVHIDLKNSWMKEEVGLLPILCSMAFFRESCKPSKIDFQLIIDWLAVYSSSNSICRSVDVIGTNFEKKNTKNMIENFMRNLLEV